MAIDIIKTHIGCNLCSRQFSRRDDKTITKIFKLHKLKAHGIEKTVFLETD